MDIGNILAAENVIENLRADDKTHLLNELCERAAKVTGLDPVSLSRDILNREQLGSTGVGGGIAIPHARVQKLDKPFGILARLRRPIDFDAIDGEPVDIVFLLLIPATGAGNHLNALAAIARKLRDQETLIRIRKAADNKALYDAIVG